MAWRANAQGELQSWIPAAASWEAVTSRSAGAAAGVGWVAVLVPESERELLGRGLRGRTPIRLPLGVIGGARTVLYGAPADEEGGWSFGLLQEPRGASESGSGRCGPNARELAAAEGPAAQEDGARKRARTDDCSREPTTVAIPRELGPGFVHPGAMLGDSITGRYIREYDWSSTSIGPIETWCRPLLSAVSAMCWAAFPVRPLSRILSELFFFFFALPR